MGTKENSPCVVILVSVSDISVEGALRREKAVEKISKLTEVERVQIIQKISESNPIDEELAKLLPWKPTKIELGSQRDSFYLLTNEKLQIERYKRELSRIRGSASFRLSNLISSSIRNPVMALMLPITAPSLVARLVREKLGYVEKNNLENYHAKVSRIPSLTDLMVIVAIGIGLTGLAHMGADIIAPWVTENAPQLNKFSLTSKFFWLIVIATTGGLILSFTKLKQYEGAGASRIGSLFLYILVATIGMKMDALAILETPGLFLIGIIWMLIHVTVLLVVGKIIKAPFFFVAVGSQANVGGAASAPIVASAFHPALAPVGVLLAVFGYALGTYAAWFCAILMQGAAG